MNKQNARLSLANAGDENPTMPRRKILLSTGGNNYRPPLERSKSAPKLFAIEEMVDEEDEEGCDEELKARKNDEKKMLEDVKPCCKEDYLYPSITLGRRRCRRGHSIRKSRLLRGSILTQKSYPPTNIPSSTENIAMEEPEAEEDACKSLESEYSVSSIPIQEPTRKSLGSDEDFESFLLYNNYDSKEPLAGDLMSYFDLQLQTPTASMITTTTTASMSDLLADDLLRKNQRTSMSMSDLIDYQSDNELEGDADSHSEIFFNQEALLETLRRQSKIENDENVQRQSLFIETNNSTDAFDSKVVEQQSTGFIFTRPPVEFEDDLASESPSLLCMNQKTICVNLDSDEGSSISSGCDTSSTVTNNTEENHLPRRGSVLDRVRSYEQLQEAYVNREVIGERGASGKFYLRSATFPHSIGSFGTSGESSITKSGTLTHVDSGNAAKIKHDDDSDELSDESGYVEFQDLSLKSVFA